MVGQGRLLSQVDARLSPIDDSDGPGGGSAIKVDYDYLRKLTMVALASFHSAYGGLSAYFGWSAEVFEAWEREYEKALPGGIVEG